MLRSVLQQVDGRVVFFSGGERDRGEKQIIVLLLQQRREKAHTLSPGCRAGHFCAKWDDKWPLVKQNFAAGNWELQEHC